MLTMLQDTWQEERIIYNLIAGWTDEIRLIISVSQDFALGSVRECSPLGKQRSTVSFSGRTSSGINQMIM
jgi:hypothetical protein